ncbi:helix-turn-helix transcriptional regulator [Robiginitalea sp. IMCC44478]|uniref:helix-turn-helix transcriptional regulator n=1 Tax=Robiginitalea sp. IMCC44478 TaxID=3459122 RepID=UPI00404156B7
MVNNEAFKSRLEKIMSYYDLSATAFADAIGVQRSSISHLLSGRNKPSLDFVMKVIQQYPEVNLYWLLNGKGSFPALSEKQSTAKVSSIPEKEIVNSSKEISKVLILYTDGSFQAYDSLN